MCCVGVSAKCRRDQHDHRRSRMGGMSIYTCPGTCFSVLCVCWPRGMTTNLARTRNISDRFASSARWCPLQTPSGSSAIAETRVTVFGCIASTTRCAQSDVYAIVIQQHVPPEWISLFRASFDLCVCVCLLALRLPCDALHTANRIQLHR